jgi:DtxR family transcriptional regulator, Mn-dependent transcriptional regulator
VGADHNFAVSAENYLKTIWNLEQKHSLPVTNRALSEALQITRPSVSQMIQKLEAQGLVRREAAARGYRLTDKGQRSALKLLRAHRLVEMYLKQSLGLDGVFLHQEAERLEHAVSEKLINEIDRYLGYPKVDFAGAPIPRFKGEAGFTSVFSDLRDEKLLLTSASVGVRQVVRIHDDSSKVLERLEACGIGVGKRIEILSVSPQTVKIKFDGQILTLSSAEAASIQVR